MSVRIRLTRAGRKKVPHYRIVVMDSRDRRDGAYLDQIGVYHPNEQPAGVKIEEEKALSWLAKGAVPSDTVKNLLSHEGIMLRFDLTKRQTPPEKIAETVAAWRQSAGEREARRELAKAQKKKDKAAKAGDAATGGSPQTT